jgi:hypothetical protein
MTTKWGIPNDRKGRLVMISILTGFFGDAFLQILARQGIGKCGSWGLKPYFKQHGTAESLFIAGGMMGLFYTLYAITGLPFEIHWLSLYAVLIDFLFRYTRLFPSLDKYYQCQSIWRTTTIGGIVPMLIPFIIYKAIYRD